MLAGGVLLLLLFLGRLGYRWRWSFGAVLAFVLFCLGAWRAVDRSNQVRTDWSDERQAYRGWVSGVPEEKRRSRLVPVEVNGRQVFLYLPKDSLSAGLTCGDEVLFFTRITPPRNWSADIGFDYATYLLRQGVSGTAYAGNGAWQKGPGRRALTWKQQALLLRQKLVDKYRDWGLEGDELAVVAALTLGDKSELDADLKESYAVSGASHILALSGLHLNIVAGLLSALLLFHVGRGWSRWARGLLILAALWAYAYITGLSGSVVRSAVMFTVFILGQCLGRRGLLLNSLALAAFAMLLYNPCYLYDVGFLMSFLAVAGIALFMPVFRQWVVCKRFWVSRYVQELLWVSVAAQLGVSPLAAYYFDNFPLYFLLTNLVVVPLSGIALVIAVALWMVAWWPALHELVADLLQWSLRLMNDAVIGVSRLPGASLDVSFLSVDVVLYYWVLVGLLVFYHVRSARVLSGVLAGTCVGLVWALFCPC